MEYICIPPPDAPTPLFQSTAEAAAAAAAAAAAVALGRKCRQDEGKHHKGKYQTVIASRPI